MIEKVEMNKCYGGFSISKECVERIENKYGMDLSYGAYYFDENGNAIIELISAETLESKVCSGDCAKIVLEEF